MWRWKLTFLVRENEEIDHFIFFSWFIDKKSFVFIWFVGSFFFPAQLKFISLDIFFGCCFFLFFQFSPAWKKDCRLNNLLTFYLNVFSVWRTWKKKGKREKLSTFLPESFVFNFLFIKLCCVSAEHPPFKKFNVASFCIFRETKCWNVCVLRSFYLSV